MASRQGTDKLLLLPSLFLHQGYPDDLLHSAGEEDEVCRRNDLKYSTTRIVKPDQNKTDMMGVDDMLLSFGISYLAGNIKEWLSKDKNVQEQIDDCLDKALMQWSVNRGIRDIERDRMNQINFLV